MVSLLNNRKTVGFLQSSIWVDRGPLTWPGLQAVLGTSLEKPHESPSPPHPSTTQTQSLEGPAHFL